MANEAVDLAHELEYVLQRDEARHRPVGELERRAAQLLLHVRLPLERRGLHHLIRLGELGRLGGEDGDVGALADALEGDGAREAAAAAEHDHVLPGHHDRRHAEELTSTKSST